MRNAMQICCFFCLNGTIIKKQKYLVGWYTTSLFRAYLLNKVHKYSHQDNYWSYVLPSLLNPYLRLVAQQPCLNYFLFILHKRGKI